jgi:hypothetical protein
MITDRELTLSDAQAITATANSTDVIAMTGLRFGRGQRLRFYVQVDTAFTAAGAATLTIALVQADNAALTTNAETLYTTAAIGKAALIPDGKKFLVDIDIPKQSKNFLGATYTVATGPMTAGAITAGFVTDTPTPLDDQPTYWTGRG